MPHGISTHKMNVYTYIQTYNILIVLFLYAYIHIIQQVSIHATNSFYLSISITEVGTYSEDAIKYIKL